MSTLSAPASDGNTLTSGATLSVPPTPLPSPLEQPPAADEAPPGSLMASTASEQPAMPGLSPETLGEGVAELTSEGMIVAPQTPPAPPAVPASLAASPPAADPATMGASQISQPVGVSTGPVGRETLLDVLVQQGALSQDQAEQLRLEAIGAGQTPESLLIERNLVNEEAMTRAEAELNNIPFVKISETGISPEALTQLPEGVARRYQLLPFAYNKVDGVLMVAMRNPLDLTAISFAEQKSNMRIIAHYAMPSELERMIAERYAQSLSTEVTAALQETDQVAEDKERYQDLANLSGSVVKQAPITKIVETILSFAMKSRASDVHIEPQELRTRVRYRIDGILMEKLILPRSVHDAVVSRIKILSNLKIDEKRIPQDGRFNFTSGPQEVDLRVSTLPTIHGEKIVMRLLKKDSTVPSLTELGLNGLALRRVEDAIKVPHGIVLVTGPTGSGKTTTLYSILNRVNTPKVNIMTLEDPVEYQMPGINQVQINPQAGLTFASGLRSFLRQDPNIIMVGEIRDSETAELAVQASLTGHLVFSTLHTSSAAGALPRLLDMGAEPFLLASSMTLAMAQRVVRKINEDFKEEYTPEPPVMADIKKVLGDRYEAWCKQNNKDPERPVLYRAKTQRPDTEPEYRGRIAIFEVMPMTEKIQRLILESKPASELEAIALQDGMLLMKQDGYLKALDGLTTIEEVLRVAQV